MDISTFIDPKYLFEPAIGQTECLQSCVEHLGIEIKAVTNYKDAIDELTRQTKPGYCDYYACWVLCGPQYAVLPPPATEREAHLVGQFNECISMFCKNGGSIFYGAEGSGLCYQVNLFLEKFDFPGGKTKLRIKETDEHQGRKILLGDDTGSLKNQTFSRNPLEFKKCSRPSFAHNLGKIYEGTTVAYANDEKEIAPFIPFARDSEGGVVILYYPADLSTGYGDIIIDCGYTKLFTEMSKDGTFRYIQSIAGWMARPENIRVMHRGMQPHEWRPKAITYTIDYNIIWNDFKERHFDILYVVDATGSMSKWIERAKHKCVTISQFVRKNHPRIKFRFGGVFYRDTAKSHDAENIDTIINFTDNENQFQSELNKVVARGGGNDGPEDWVSAYTEATSFHWENGNRLIIHIADAPPHGVRFGGFNLDGEAVKLENLIKKCAGMRIQIFGMAIDNKVGDTPPKLAFTECKKIYDQIHQIGNSFKWIFFESDNGTSNIDEYFEKSIINAITCAAPKQ